MVLGALVDPMLAPVAVEALPAWAVVVAVVVVDAAAEEGGSYERKENYNNGNSFFDTGRNDTNDGRIVGALNGRTNRDRADCLALKRQVIRDSRRGSKCSDRCCLTWVL